MMNDIDNIISKYKGRDLSLVRNRDADRSKFPNQDRPTGQYKIHKSEENLPDKELDFDTAMQGFKTLLLQKSGKVIIHPDNHVKLVNLIKNAIGEPGPLTPSKGVYMSGDNSRGKTFTMTCLTAMMAFAWQAGYKNGWDHFKLISFKTNIMFRAREEKDISFLTEIFTGARHIILDDLGYEDDIQLVLWGNKENIVVHIIDILYHEFQAHGTKLYITSNLPVKTILEKFGKGTHDRIMEMCTPISWGGNYNYRTQKMEP